MIHIIAGEVGRLLAILNGAKSLKKNDILEALQKLGDREALEIYRAYLNERKLKFSEEFLIEFIKSRIDRIIKEL